MNEKWFWGAVVCMCGLTLAYHLLRCGTVRDIVWSVVGVLVMGLVAWVIFDEKQDVEVE